MTRLHLADSLAAVNAVLNATSATLAILGWRAIRRGERDVHPRYMLAALSCSVLFLVSYITRMALSGTHRFDGPAWLKATYLAILASHVLLATVVPFVVVAAAWLALRGRLPAHVRLVRFALPAWLYVSATGVIVYVLVYGVSR